MRLINADELIITIEAMGFLSKTDFDIMCKIINNVQSTPPQYFPPCEDCRTKMDEIRSAYDKLQGAKGHNSTK